MVRHFEDEGRRHRYELRRCIPVTIGFQLNGERERDISQVFDVVNSRIQPKLGILPKYSVMVYVEDLVRGFIDAAESKNTLGQAYFLNPQV